MDNTANDLAQMIRTTIAACRKELKKVETRTRTHLIVISGLYVCVPATVEEAKKPLTLDTNPLHASWLTQNQAESIAPSIKNKIDTGKPIFWREALKTTIAKYSEILNRIEGKQ